MALVKLQLGNQTLKRRKMRGFTIVELLIVIVVIGILAVIAIVSYNGIQTRAENTRTSTAAKAYKSALIAYAIDNGSYPITGTACLGIGYPDINIDGIGDCGSNNGVVTYSNNSTMDTALKKYGGSAQPSNKQYTVGGWTQFGVTYEYIPSWILDGASHYWWLSYELGGSNEKCANSIGGISMAGGGTNLSSTPQVGWNGASENWPSAIKCWLPLPNPAKL